ncbi:MAG: hypothetical protein RLZZ401_560, partial [Pseudomonadota bacterium]
MPADIPSPPEPSPSRLLRAGAGIARWLFGVLLASWLLLIAGWGLLHGWIVPRIGDYRELIEQQATQRLGLPVRIGQVSAESVGWVPSFALRDVRLQDAQGRDALALGRVVLVLSPQSLLQFGFEQLTIEQPELDIRRALDGTVTVAGIDVSAGAAGGGDSAALEWLLDQKELLISQGKIRWTDAQRAAPAVALTGVNFLMRNSVRRHSFRLDAQLPPDWGGQGVTATAQFRQPLLTLRSSKWQEWEGRAYAMAAQVDVAQLGRYLDLGTHRVQGKGAVRLWTDIRRGQLTAATVDLALAEASARLGPQLEPLVLRTLTGRLSATRLPKGVELTTEKLQFMVSDGRQWPGGNVKLRWLDATATQPIKFELHADRLDLAAVRQIAGQLPLGSAVHQALNTYAPRGLVDVIDASWQLPAEESGALRFSARGRVEAVHIAAGPVAKAAGAVKPELGTPGVQGADLDFDLNQSGGKARLALRRGSLEFPGMFAHPLIPVDQLSADLQWQVVPGKAGSKVSVQANRVRFANADAEGEAQASWHTSDAAKSGARSRFPGVLDLQGSLSRFDAAQLWRYLPLVIATPARDYVHAAVLQGRASGVKFKLRGELYEMPFVDPQAGEFRVSADIQNATYAYIPAWSAEPSGAAPPVRQWPALTQLSGQLVLDRTNLHFHGANARVEGLSGIQLLRGEAQVANLGQNLLVQVSADARGPMAEALALVNSTPIGSWTGQVLQNASATGPADLRLRLTLPIAEMEKARVQGTLTFAGNDVRLAPEVPAFSRVRGA